MVQVHGVSKTPTSTDTIKVSAETGTEATHSIPLPFDNPKRDDALKYAGKEFGMVVEGLGGGKTPRGKGKGEDAPAIPPMILRVDCQGFGAPMFHMNQQVMLQPPGAAKVEVQDERMGIGAVDLIFAPADVIEYQAEVVVYGPGDIRVFKLEGSGKSPGTEANLKFSAPARQVSKQLIPIVNQTDKPWSINAQFECPDCPKAFTGPAAISVAPFSTGQYPLEFSPIWMTDCEGSVLLKNTTIDDKYLYNLLGNCEEPLAESHIVIECSVWEKNPLICKVPLIASDGEEVTVESDLLYISGPATVLMEKGNKAIEVELSVCPKQSGVYSGSVTFTAPSGEFAWFTVEVQATPAPPVQTLPINTALRQAVGLDIAITNPLDMPVIFDVDIQGDGLLGESFVQLAARESAVYELIFSPLNYGEWEGGITFTNKDAGEFWYRLELSADKPSAIVLEDMECEIGKEMTQVLTMENPIGEMLELEVTNSNDTNYEFLTEEPYLLEGYGKLEVEFNYTPSSLKGDENAVFFFKHPKVADWEFHVKGRGIPPTLMQKTLFYAPLGRSVSDTVAFRNPFQQPISVGISFQATDATSDNFDLLLKKTTQTVAGYSTLQIPVKFNAPNLDDARGSVIVDAPANGVRWTFPLSGHVFADTEAASSFHYTCRARSRLEETLEIELTGLREVDGEVPVTFEMKVPEAQERLFSRALTIEPAGPLIASATAPLKFNLTFEPLRPLNAVIQFMIHRANGGVWKYDLELEATEPEIDDTIVIASLLGQPSSVTFSLTNQFTVYTPFKAYFTPDSALEFSVEPKSGLLEPFGSGGTQFIVSYTSTAYGRVDTGRLVILTEEMQWTYEVRGTLPQYKPPEGENKVNTRLPDEVDAVLHDIHTRPKKKYLRDQSRRPPR